MKKLSKLLVIVLTLAMLLGVVAISASALDLSGKAVDYYRDGELVQGYDTVEAAITAANADQNYQDVTIRLSKGMAITKSLTVTRDSKYGKVILDLNGFELDAPVNLRKTGIALEYIAAGNGYAEKAPEGTTVPTSTNYNSGMVMGGAMQVSGNAYFEVDGNGGSVRTTGQCDVFFIDDGNPNAELFVHELSWNYSSPAYRENYFCKINSGEATFDSVYLERKSYPVMDYFRQASDAQLNIRNSFMCNPYFDRYNAGLIVTEGTNTGEAADGYHIEIENCTIISAGDFIRGSHTRYNTAAVCVTSNSVNYFYGKEVRIAGETYVNTDIKVDNCNIEIVNYNGAARNDNGALIGNGGCMNVDFENSNILLAQRGIRDVEATDMDCVVNFRDCYIEFTGKGYLYGGNEKFGLVYSNANTEVHLYGTEMRVSDLITVDGGNTIPTKAQVLSAKYYFTTMARDAGTSYGYNTYAAITVHEGCLFDTACAPTIAMPVLSTDCTTATVGDTVLVYAKNTAAPAYTPANVAEIQWSSKPGSDSWTPKTGLSNTVLITPVSGVYSISASVKYSSAEAAISNANPYTNVILNAPALKVLVNAPGTVITNGNAFTYFSNAYKGTAVDGGIKFTLADASELVTVTYQYPGEAEVTETFVGGGYFWLDLDKVPEGTAFFDVDKGTMSQTVLNINGEKITGNFENYAEIVLDGDISIKFESEDGVQYGWAILNKDGEYDDNSVIGKPYADLVAAVADIEKLMNPFSNAADAPDFVVENGAVTGIAPEILATLSQSPYRTEGYTIKLYDDFENVEPLNLYSHAAKDKVVNYDLNGHKVSYKTYIAKFTQSYMLWEYSASGYTDGDVTVAPYTVVQIHGVDQNGNQVSDYKAFKNNANTYHLAVTHATGYGINVISSETGAAIVAPNTTTSTGLVDTFMQEEFRVKISGTNKKIHQYNYCAPFVSIGNKATEGIVGPNENVINVETATLLRNKYIKAVATVQNLNVISAAESGIINCSEGYTDIKNCTILSTHAQGKGMITSGYVVERCSIVDCNLISENPQNLYNGAGSRVSYNSSANEIFCGVASSRLYNLYIDSTSKPGLTSGSAVSGYDSIVFIGEDCLYNLEYNPTEWEGVVYIKLRASRKTGANFLANAIANETVVINGKSYTFTYKVTDEAYTVTWQAGSTTTTENYAKGVTPVYSGVLTEVVDAVSSIKFEFVGIVPVSADVTYVATEKYIPTFVKHNIATDVDFVHHFKILKNVGGTDILSLIKSIALNGVTYYDAASGINELDEDGTYWIVSAPVKSNETLASNKFEIVFDNLSGRTDIAATMNASVYNYLENIVKYEDNTTLYNLFASIAKYSAASYAKFGGNDAVTAIEMLNALVPADYEIGYEVPGVAAGAAGEYFDVEFVLNENTMYRFYLNTALIEANIADEYLAEADFMAYVTVSVKYFDNEKGETVNYTGDTIKNNGEDYWFEYYLPAYDMAGDIQITVEFEGKTGDVIETVTYNIASYYADASAAENPDQALLDLTEALYVYTQCAKANKAAAN